MGAVANFVDSYNGKKGRPGAAISFSKFRVRHASRGWEAFLRDPKMNFSPPTNWPSITDILTTLDIAIRDDFTLGTYTVSNEDESKQIVGNELRRVRRRVVSDTWGTRFQLMMLGFQRFFCLIDRSS
jgi:hypothetical protein